MNSAGWQEWRQGPDSGEWALISSWDVRVPGIKVRAGGPCRTLRGARPCFLPFTSWGSWTWGPLGQQLRASLNQHCPWEGVLSLCALAIPQPSWPTLQNSSLEKKLLPLSRAEHLGILWWVRPSEAFCLPEQGRGETQALLLLPSWLPRWGAWEGSPLSP